MMRFLSLLVSITVISLALLSSCIKDNNDEVNYNPNVLSSKDYVYAEDAVLEIFQSFFKGINDSSALNNGYGYVDFCDVTYNSTEKMMRFGYGDVNRYCSDNKFRRGGFDAVFEGDVFQAGTIAHLSTDSLFVNDCLVDCAIDIENLGAGNNGFIVYSMNVISSDIAADDTTKAFSIRLMSEYFLEWAQGYATPPDYADDMFLLTGSAEGSSSDGYDFSVSVVSPLENYLDCFWVSRGVNEITVPAAKYPTGEINYVDEDGCFNQVEFLFNENLFFDFMK